jgi:hypothetical protein
VVIVRQIPGYPEYRAGSDGLIYSAWKRGGPGRWYVGTVFTQLKPQVNKKTGYPEVGLRRNGKQEWKTVHGLICLAWHGTPPDEMECCHKDGNRLNSLPDNMSYKTKSDNMADKYAHGTMPRIDEPVTLKRFMKQLRRLESPS